MITALSLTQGTLTVIIDNGVQIIPVRNDNPRWAELMDIYRQFDVGPNGQLVGPEAKLFSLLSLKSIIEDYTVGNLSVNATGVTFRGKPVHTVDAERVMAFLRDGLPYKPIANYIERKFKNPSARAIAEMYNFLEHKGMPLTPAGTFIAYKGVELDFYSVHGNLDTVVIQGTVDESGRLLNTVGSIIEVERSSVNDDFRQGCSFGLHAGSLSYAKGWGSRVVLVEIDPADVVSVPSDCNCQKLRCCKYKVIGEYTGPMPDTYTDEFSSETLEDEVEDDENEEDEAPAPSPTSASYKMNTFKRLARILHEEFAIRDDIFPQMRIDSPEFNLDSLDAVELVLAIEEEFGFEIPDDNAEKFTTKTIAEIATAIDAELNQISNGVPPIPNAPMPPPEAVPIPNAPLPPPEAVPIPNAPVEDNCPVCGYDTFACTCAKQFDSYAQGRAAGVSDREGGASPRYLPTDEAAADSVNHQQYIEGYLKGFSSGH